MEILDAVIVAALAAAPSILIAAWAWFKANAAQTEAKWDDKAVEFVEEVAQKVVDRKSAE